jgi:hypothetical protein
VTLWRICSAMNEAKNGGGDIQQPSGGTIAYSAGRKEIHSFRYFVPV